VSIYIGCVGNKLGVGSHITREMLDIQPTKLGCIGEKQECVCCQIGTQLVYNSKVILLLISLKTTFGTPHYQKGPKRRNMFIVDK